VAEVQPLSRKHDREAFDCGSEALNAFLKTTARQHQDRGISRTFVLVEPDSAAPTRVIGFFALSACEGIASDLPPSLAKRLPRNLPTVLLGRLAVDRNFQGQGYGSALLVEAIRRVAATASQIGIAGLFVDAKDEGASAFYQKFGFVPLPSKLSEGYYQRVAGRRPRGNWVVQCANS
jgi:GNAT superfamily N-acetyltransferase